METYFSSQRKQITKRLSLISEFKKILSIMVCMQQTLPADKLEFQYMKPMLQPLGLTM